MTIIILGFFYFLYVTLQIVMRTLNDLQRLYPEIITKTQLSKIEDKSIDQVIIVSTLNKLHLK